MTESRSAPSTDAGDRKRAVKGHKDISGYMHLHYADGDGFTGVCVYIYTHYIYVKTSSKLYSLNMQLMSTISKKCC